MNALTTKLMLISIVIFNPNFLIHPNHNANNFDCLLITMFVTLNLMLITRASKSQIFSLLAFSTFLLWNVDIWALLKWMQCNVDNVLVFNVEN